MKRLLHPIVLSAVVFLVVPLVATAQGDTWAERQSQRAERAAERAADRAERTADRLEERAERFGESVEQGAERAGQRIQERAEWLQERVERRLDRGFGSGRGARILIGKSFTLPEGARAPEGILVVGGNATIDGTADGDVLVVGGRLRIGPKAIIRGDVATFGGELDRDPGARIDGEVDTAHVYWPDWNWAVNFPELSPIWWQGAAFAFTIGRFVLVMFLSILLVVIAPRWTGSIASRLSSGPVGSAAAGFAAEILFAPALIFLSIALIITIIGIPLLAGLPFLVATFGLLWVGGYAAVAGVVGARLRGSEWSVNGVGAFDVVLGSFLLSGITLLGQVLMITSDWLGPLPILVRSTGWTIEYLAWTIGLGAALTAWRRTDGFDPRSVPPVVPPLPTPSPSAL
jgi:hypothetical protein